MKQGFVLSIIVMLSISCFADTLVFDPNGVIDLPSTADPKANMSLSSMSVSIDIKPKTCPNPFNVRSKGVLTVAISGSEELDVFNIDPITIMLEGVVPLRYSYEDVSTPVPNETDCTCVANDSDGYIDLVLKFDRQDILSVFGNVFDGQELLLYLNGSLTDGTEIEGTDCIFILKKGKKHPPVDMDEDGYDATVDCNDLNPTIHPNADEVCDGIDNDCDGVIDEDCIMEIDSCQILDQSSQYYRLTRNIPEEEVVPNCIDIIAPDIIFDGQGYSIRHTDLNSNLIRSNQNNTVIQNCVLVGNSTNDQSRAILTTGNIAHIRNNRVHNSYYGIEARGNWTTINMNYVSNSRKAYHLLNAKHNIVKNNYATKSYWGFISWNGSNNDFINNKGYKNSFNLVINGSDYIDVICGNYESGEPFDIYLYKGTNYSTKAYNVAYDPTSSANVNEMKHYDFDCSAMDCVWQGEQCIPYTYDGCEDMDGDGYFEFQVNCYSGDDCDDNNLNIHPDIEEVSPKGEKENKKGSSPAQKSNKPSFRGNGEIEVGDIAPEFTLANLDDTLVNLSKLTQESDTLVIFGNTRCPHCARKIPLLNELSDSGLMVVFVIIGDSQETVEQYAQRHNIRFQMLLDTERTVARQYGIRSIPQGYLITSDNTVVMGGAKETVDLWAFLSSWEIQ